MKLSQSTIEILKNFAGINPGVVLRQGNKLATQSIPGTIYAETIIAESIPQTAAIYSLNEFLGVLGLFTDPDITFHDTYFLIKEGQQTVKYYYANESSIVSPNPDKERKFPEDDCEYHFKLTDTDMVKIMDSSRVMRLNTLCINKDGIRVVNDIVKDKASDMKLSVAVDTNNDETKYMDIGNLKIIPGNYDVKIAKKVKPNGMEFWISKFANVEDPNLVYFIALKSETK